MNLQSLIADNDHQFDWDELSEDLSIAQRIDITEAYFANNKLLESDEHAVEYFLNLPSDTLIQDRKYIVVPLLLIQNTVKTLNRNVLYLTYQSKTNDSLIFVNDSGEQKTYPETSNSRGIYKTFVFDNTDTYNKFRTILKMKFNTDLFPADNINETREPYQLAIDRLEQRRIEDLEAKMDDYAQRAKESKDPKYIAAMRHAFAKAKAERDSYYGVTSASVDEGWSDKYVAQRTGRLRTPYSVYISGKKWKDFENDDHARAVMDKLKAKFKADGRDPETVTIAPTDIPESVDKKSNEHELLQSLAQQWQEGSDDALNKIQQLGWNIADDRRGVYVIKQTDMTGRSKIYFPELTAEGSMSSAEQHPTGPEFTGYWKGTDAGTPGDKMAGGCEESADKSSARNFVIKNMKQSGQGRHKDMKRADKQGNIKHKAQRIPMDEAVAGPEKCWPGYRKVGTKPGTGKNTGKRVNDCEKIKEDEVEEGIGGNMQVRSTPLNLRTPKVPQISKAGKGPHNNALKKAQAKRMSENFVQWAVKEGYTNFASNPAVYEQARQAYDAANNATVHEDWQKANKKDKTDGMSKKAVKAYRRENPGSKLKTAVTTKPSKLKKGSKDSKRRTSYCARSAGQKKMHNIDCSKTPDKAICKARRRWNCESQEQFDRALFETMEKNKVLEPGEYFVWTVYFDDGTNKRIKVTKDTFNPKAYYAKKNQNVIKVDYSWEVHNG